MNEITFKKDPFHERNKQIGVWIPKSIKELYMLLDQEYGVDMPSEIKKAVIERIEKLRNEIILAKDIA